MKFFKYIFFILIILFILALAGCIWYFRPISNSNTHTAEEFQIATLKSKTDYDHDGIDDYTDILQGAKIEAKNKPTYKSAYYQRRISTR